VGYREPEGVADDAIFARTGASAGSIADEFQYAGVHFQRCGKADRISGWQTVKRSLANAGKPDMAGLFISRAYTAFWATVPYLARDERRSEDVDTHGNHDGDQRLGAAHQQRYLAGSVRKANTYA
jgi:hypothetical protein